MKNLSRIAQIKRFIQKSFCGKLETLGLKGAFVGESSNLRYFTGYSGPGLLELNCLEKESILYVPLLEYLRASEYGGHSVDQVVALTNGLPHPSYAESVFTQPASSLISNCSNNKYAVIGLDKERSYSNDCPDVTDELMKFKTVKNTLEIQLYKEATSITDSILVETVEKVFSEELQTTGDVWWYLKRRAHEAGEGTSFEPIVAVDREASLPHAPLNVSMSIKGSKVLLIDYGLYVDSYATDLTRIVLLSNEWKIRAQLDVLVNSLEIAMDYMRAGVPSWMPDTIVRHFLSTVGLSEFFVHSLGHGVGSSVHEPPRLSPNSRDILVENMIVTVEPGVYIREYGLRVESMVLIGDDGSMKIDKSPLVFA